jgi:ankyrin repeat protein
MSITCDDITVLHVAAAAHSPKSVQLLLDNGADVNTQTLDGTTPLHCAIQYGDFIAAKVIHREPT